MECIILVLGLGGCLIIIIGSFILVVVFSFVGLLLFVFLVIKIFILCWVNNVIFVFLLKGGCVIKIVVLGILMGFIIFRILFFGNFVSGDWWFVVKNIVRFLVSFEFMFV